MDDSNSRLAGNPEVLRLAADKHCGSGSDIHTDIHRWHKCKRPNLEVLRELTAAVSILVIVSGGAAL